MECYCDYDYTYDAYVVSTHKARKPNKCYECHHPIRPGERYERVFTLYDGRVQIARTCTRCLNLREWVQAHVPCFCWAHGNMIEDAISTAEKYAHESPGLMFSVLRRYALIRRGN